MFSTPLSVPVAWVHPTGEDLVSGLPATFTLQFAQLPEGALFIIY